MTSNSAGPHIFHVCKKLLHAGDRAPEVRVVNPEIAELDGAARLFAFSGVKIAELLPRIMAHFETLDPAVGAPLLEDCRRLHDAVKSFSPVSAGHPADFLTSSGDYK